MATQQSTSGAAVVPVTPMHLRVGNVLVRVLYFWVLFGVIVLTLRVFLLAFSANPSTNFVTFIYETSSRYLEPFRGIFPAKPVSETGYFDVSAVFAIIMYLLFMWAVSALIAYVERSIAEAQRRSLLQTNNKESKG